MPLPARLPLAVLALFPALAACASWNDAAGGPFFQAGVGDGCRTAEARNASFSTETFRDDALFDEEESYRAGWRSGFEQCQPLADPTARPEDLGEQELGF